MLICMAVLAVIIRGIRIGAMLFVMVIYVVLNVSHVRLGQSGKRLIRVSINWLFYTLQEIVVSVFSHCS
jgi:hypothetical protein